MFLLTPNCRENGSGFSPKTRLKEQEKIQVLLERARIALALILFAPRKKRLLFYFKYVTITLYKLI